MIYTPGNLQFKNLDHSILRVDIFKNCPSTRNCLHNKNNPTLNIEAAFQLPSTFFN